ncbi:hypothetical protein ACEN2T_23310 [Pseudomonas sp. W22_MBD1_FP4]|uniref:hypothetical protein n=1 Tax=Pseudomonas sp. W22_MBD1_FP4 TaxID=3240272 RepID=UPI003F9D3092
MATTQRIIPDGSDGFIEVDWYEDKHRPDRQEKADQTYPLNPILRECFSNTPNQFREPLELEDWWELPYIESTTWEDSEAWRRECIQRRGESLDAAEIEASVEEHKKQFFESYPTGTRFIVHCLDGGAWDRPTMWGDFSTLEETIECCSKGPVWRKHKSQIYRLESDSPFCARLVLSNL